MRRVFFAAVLLAAPVFAQQKPESTTRMITLKHADPQEISGVIRMFEVNVNVNSQFKIISISGLSDKVAAAEAAIHKLDVSPKTIELVVHFVVGSDQTNLTGSAVPADVRDVISQLRNVFTFKDYRMLDTLSLRTRAGSSAETTGILDSRANPRLSQFSIRNSSVSEDGATIRIDRMHAGLRIPMRRNGPVDAKGGAAAQAKVDYMNTGIDQDIDVKEGQKVVVGRSSLEGPEKALFLILTAKVIQ